MMKIMMKICFFKEWLRQDLETEHLKAKDKARVAKIIREVKEVDYNNAIRLEKRLLKDIENVNKEITKGLKKELLMKLRKRQLKSVLN
jgi:DNA repair protein SbcC/Rad50